MFQNNLYIDMVKYLFFGHGLCNLIKNLKVYLNGSLGFQLNTNSARLLFINHRVLKTMIFLFMYTDIYFSIFEGISKVSETNLLISLIKRLPSNLFRLWKLAYIKSSYILNLSVFAS